jgi:hypothetical protein
LYLNLLPTDDERCVVSARLEEGRSFLDSEVDVLFARYGVGLQEWTLVGIIGHHGMSEDVDMDDADFMDDEHVVRSRFSEYVSRFTKLLGQLGLIDLVQAPAFSVVPIAVYRVLNPRSFSNELVAQ